MTQEEREKTRGILESMTNIVVALLPDGPLDKGDVLKALYGAEKAIKNYLFTPKI